jgi:intein/homing endonuclease
MSGWWDFFKLFTYALDTKGPLEKKKDPKQLQGVGTTQPDVIPDLRNTDGHTAGANSFIRVQNDLVDLTSTTNRTNRYKEYDRLVASVAEIEMAMTVFADEACISGDTEIATVFHGFQRIDWLTKYKKDARFPVYCYDFDKQDYNIGWAFNPRPVKKAPTIHILLDNGSCETVTPDHRILTREGYWVRAEELKHGDELMPFYRVKAEQNLTKLKTNQYPRIFTFTDGWIHERQFIDEWRLGRDLEEYDRPNKAARLICTGLNVRQMAKAMKHEWITIHTSLRKIGFSYRELRYLGKKHQDRRRVIGIHPGPNIQVYDLSVEKYENFCTRSLVMHNCQKNEDNHVFKITCDSQEVVDELEFLFFHRSMLNLNQLSMWDKCKRLFIKGDSFWEIVINPDNPKEGIYKIQDLPPESMYRIETTKGKLLEFQQGKEGPDYQAIQKAPVETATETELAQSNAIRMTPEQIIHIRLGDYRKTFYPYGVSLIEAARGPAHQLRMMEDAMVTYRLVRAPERRVFYIDVGQLPSFKAEAFMERMKDQFKKKKVVSGKGGGGASAVEERWHAPAMDEDFWIPIRPSSNTRVETLPGACLDLNTEIPLLDGRVLRLHEIITEFEAGKELWVYSCNPETGKVVPGPITWAGITRKNAEVLKITFDNEKSIICTPDHKFPVLDKGFVEAKNLSVGESLIPFNTRLEKIRPSRESFYKQVYDSCEKKWIFVHRLVAGYTRGTFLERQMVWREEFAHEKKNVVHHENYNRLDNTPGNLIWMSWHDHEAFHRDNQHITNKNISSALKKYHISLSEEEKEKRDNILQELAFLGSAATLEKLKDPKFNAEFRQKQIDGWVKAKKERPEVHKARGEKITKRNLEFWSDEDNKKKAFAKQTIVYPQSIFDIFTKLLADGKHLEEIIPIINSNKDLIEDFISANTHIVREDVKLENGLNDEHVAKMVKSYGYKTIHELRKKINPDKKFYGRKKGSGLKYPKPMMDKFMSLLTKGYSVKDSLSQISANTELMSLYAEENKNVGYQKDLGKLTTTTALRMVKSYGYEGLTQARQEAHLYNHKIVSIEYLDTKMDTGTITVGELLHNFHTFAINDLVFVKNSSLGEVDDTVYFRNKLFTALNFPKNYFSLEDPNATRITLSAQDVKFARLVERLQSYVEDALWEVADRHLRLRGFPPESYEDLAIKMTPPSDWRELSRAEVVTNRINNANGLKGSQLMADFDILVKWMKYTEDEANEMISRMKIQKLEDLKLQVLAQNPQLLGVGVPGAGEQEMGTEPGGPNPMLGPPQQQQMPPEGQQMSPQGQQPPPMPPPPQEGGMMPSAKQAKPLPEPTDEEISMYDMEIQDYDAEQDAEDVDYSEAD